MPAVLPILLQRLGVCLALLLAPALALADEAAGQAIHSLNRGYLQAYPDAYADPAALDAPFAHLDWYPNPDGFSFETHCDGGYRQPNFNFADLLLPREQQPIHARADSSSTEGDRVTRMQGNVLLRKGDSQIRSHSATVLHQQQQANMEGLIQMREPNLLVLGSRAEIDMATREARISEAQFVIHDSQLRGDARAVERKDNGNVVIHDGRYTRCQPGNDSWTINGSKIVLRPKTGLGSVKHATLRINDIPVLYVPYIYFPIDDRRISGFLAPNFSYTNTNGYDFSVPYYFNIAPDYDDTLIVRLLAKRGVQLENEFRHLNRYGLFTTSLSWLDNDKQEGDDRWLAGFDHKGSPAPRWSSYIDYTRVSDNSYFDDLGTNLKINRDNHLQQYGRLQYNHSGFNFSLVAQDYQVLDLAVNEPYAKLPQLTLWGSPKLFKSDRLQLSYLAEATRFDRNPANFSGSDRTTGDRVHLQTSISAPFNWPWAFIRPATTFSFTQYRLDHQPSGNDDTPSRSQPQFSLDAGLFFERPVEVSTMPFTQTLEPRLLLVETPERDQSELPNFDSGELTFNFSQLFRPDRFSGRDRIGDTRQATLGLTSRLLTPQGSERLTLSAGQIFYFEHRQVRLDAADPALTDERSAFAAEADWQATPELRLGADLLMSEGLSRNLARNLKLSYRSDLDHQFNASYRFTDDELEQVDLSAIWPLSPQWSLLTRWLYDLDNSEPLDQILGLEYENCCWRIRTLYRHWVNESADQRENNGVFLQLVLKGLGRVGAQAAGDEGSLARSFLKEISGFEEREDL